MFWIRGYVGREKCEKKSKFRSEGKSSIKGEVIQEQDLVGTQANHELGQRSKALGIFTMGPKLNF
jgi:hypothetical protein